MRNTNINTGEHLFSLPVLHAKLTSHTNYTDKDEIQIGYHLHNSTLHISYLDNVFITMENTGDEKQKTVNFCRSVNENTQLDYLLPGWNSVLKL